MPLSKGVTYSGAVKTDRGKIIPNGIGSCKYSDHNEHGVFVDGELNGVAYLNYHKWMMIGMCSKGRINGWGMQVKDREFSFGVFLDNELKVDLTPLVSIFWYKIMDTDIRLHIDAVNVLNKSEIFVGIPQLMLEGKFGFHFLNNGEVYLGQSDYNQNGRTGKYLHFGIGYNINRGEYKDDILVRQISNTEFIDSCPVYVTHAYLDFDIGMNYSPKSFLLNKKKLLLINEIGKTLTKLIVKANICKVVHDRIECIRGKNETSTWFMFPLDRRDVCDELIGLCYNEEPWLPDFNDYRVEFHDDFREAENYHQTIYKHVSCWDKNASFELDLYSLTDPREYGAEFNSNADISTAGNIFNLIPDFLTKKAQLINQWKNDRWYLTYPNVKEYIKSLAYGNDVNDFFIWLFNDQHLKSRDAWSLPPSYNNAFNQFLELFYDENG